MSTLIGKLVLQAYNGERWEFIDSAENTEEGHDFLYAEMQNLPYMIMRIRRIEHPI